MAAADDDYAFWSGGTWTERPAQDGVRLGEVRCSSRNFCLGTDRDTTAVWNGSRWSIGEPLPPDARALMLDVAGGFPSCPADGWCMLTAPGVVYLYTEET
jgi:hypothetical protein